MDAKQRISFYWLLMGVCFILHNLLHLFGLFFGENITLPNTTGEVPLFVQVFNTVVMTGTFVMALLAANLNGKGFNWFSLVWSGLFLLLNASHLYETLFIEKFDVSQAVLLTLVLVINVLLILALWKGVRKV
ncbi:MAG: hypothetical protein LBH32_03975 [Dysgonamonadaceae bacterium]|jgi:hypothetical protein|nr:hypothetical protein [Dysgonamonadaceae bacterium]